MSEQVESAPGGNAGEIVDTIIRVDVSDVQPYATNPRVITEQSVSDMAALIQAHGFRVPILVRSGDGVWDLVDGHLRLRAAHKLGITALPAIDVSDMTDSQIAAFRLSVNRAAELANWDDALLANELASLRDEDVSLLAMTGFDDSYLSALTEPEPPAPAPPAAVTGQTVNQSADRRRVTSEADRVNLIVPMTVADRTRAMAALDTIMQARAMNSRAEALLAVLADASAPAAAPAATTRRRRGN